QKAFAVVVQTADRIHPLLYPAQKFHHGRSALRIAHRGDRVVGLVEGDVDEAFRSVDQAAVGLDVVAFEVGLRAEFGDHLTVDGHTPLDDHLLRVPARRYTGMGEDFLEPLFGHQDSPEVGDSEVGDAASACTSAGAASNAIRRISSNSLSV